MRFRSVGLAAALALSIPAFAPTASASVPRAGRPVVKFAFASNALNAGQRPVLRFRVAGAPKGFTLILERANGTTHAWRAVESLGRKAGGTRTAPGVPMGAWSYRVVLLIGRRARAVSTIERLYSYGNVSFDALCNAVSGCHASPSTIQIGNSVFSYELSDGVSSTVNACSWCTIATQAPNENTWVQVSNGTCTSMTVSEGVVSNDGLPSELGTVAVIRTDADPQTFTVPPGEIATTTFQLDNTPYYVEDWASAGAKLAIYASVSLHCYTPTGVRGT